MSEEGETGSNKVSATVDAVTGLVTAIPIYQDAVQPVAKQIGKSLETVGKLVNVALAPVGLLVWGYDQCEDFIKTKVASRLKDVPPEDIITPKPNVAGPAIEALRYTGHEESLSDMYASLLATAMDKKTADGAHPAFVEMIKQFTPDEAKLMAMFMGEGPFPLITVRSTSINGGGVNIAANISLFGKVANLTSERLLPAYLDNLSRLGLINIPVKYAYTDAGVYDALEASELVQHYKQVAERLPDRKCTLERGAVLITDLGNQFGDVCIHDHRAG